jgi:hypothetical protein
VGIAIKERNTRLIEGERCMRDGREVLVRNAVCVLENPCFAP